MIQKERNKYKHTGVQVSLLFGMPYGRIGRTQALSRVTGCIILLVLRSLGDVDRVVVRKDII